MLPPAPPAPSKRAAAPVFPDRFFGRSPERAAVTRPQRLQFPATEAAGATLHLDVRPAAAPELAYVTEQIIEQCARYFGYRAITRIVMHPAYGMFDVEEPITKKSSPPAPELFP